MGITATATHALVFVLAIEAFAIEPMLANLAAFTVALVVSFSGHSRWTFRPRNGALAPPASSAAFCRFFLVALLGFALNSLVIFVVIDLLAWPYQAALAFMVFVVPVVVFLLCKYWAFTEAVP